jgi:hypothetical protein
MKTAPFDLEKALAGHPLVTRDGRPVQNFTTRKGLASTIYPYCAEVGSAPFTYTRAGRVLPAQEDPLDLFLAVNEVPPPSPRFSVGDIVRHRASGTRGVVTAAVPDGAGPACYRISTDFVVELAVVPEIVLEPWTPPRYGLPADAAWNIGGIQPNAPAICPL